MTTPINAAVFREYDIRGRAAEDLNDEFVLALGRAYGTVVRRAGGGQGALGRDCRHSGLRILSRFAEGVQSTGVDVLNLGVVATPMVYFALQQDGIDGGVAITGSHNPPAWNGFKLCLGTQSIYGTGIQQLHTLMRNGDFEVGEGRCEPKNIVPSYVSACTTALRPIKRPVRVVIDAGNGTGGIAAGDVYRAMGAEVEELFCEPNGDFPNHHPDPTVEANLVAIRARVAESKADLGIAFDGDADRIGAIDAKGRIIWGDQLLTFFGRALLQEEPDAKIVGEVKCSKVMYDALREAGGDVEMWKVGHSLIKARMKETGALLAGEMSGHLFFADRYYGYDDAIYAGARLIELLGNTDQALHDWVDALPLTHVTPEIRVACDDQAKFEVTARAAAHFSKTYPVIDVDGVRIEFPTGWGLVRASNTQPVLVLRFEADSEARRDEYHQEVLNWLTHNAPEVDLSADTHH